MEFITAENLSLAGIIVSFIWLCKIVYETEEHTWLLFTLVMIYLPVILDIKKYKVPLVIHILSILIFLGTKAA